MTTGMSLRHTYRGIVLYTHYRDRYDATIDVPERLQTRGRLRKSTTDDIVELTNMGYFTPAVEKQP